MYGLVVPLVPLELEPSDAERLKVCCDCCEPDEDEVFSDRDPLDCGGAANQGDNMFIIISIEKINVERNTFCF